jgi:hypothetical protein
VNKYVYEQVFDPCTKALPFRPSRKMSEILQFLLWFNGEKIKHVQNMTCKFNCLVVDVVNDTCMNDCHAVAKPEICLSRGN